MPWGKGQSFIAKYQHKSLALGELLIISINQITSRRKFVFDLHMIKTFNLYSRSAIGWIHFEPFMLCFDGIFTIITAVHMVSLKKK